MINLKPFQQRADFCGPASLKMVLHHFGIEKTEKQIANKVGATPSLGIEAEDLLKVAKKWGLKGRIQDSSKLEDLTHWVKKKKIPIIVEWFFEDDGHFSVVVDIDRENVYLQDPDLGHVRAFTRKKFLRIWFTFPTLYMKKESDLILRRMLILHK
jgi:predicted double-glycine peptidase